MEEEEEEEGEEGERLVTPLGEDLVTLSTLPKSRWSNLQNLDVIKVCACKSPPTQESRQTTQHTTRSFPNFMKLNVYLSSSYKVPSERKN